MFVVAVAVAVGVVFVVGVGVVVAVGVVTPSLRIFVDNGRLVVEYQPTEGKEIVTVRVADKYKAAHFVAFMSSWLQSEADALFGKGDSE